jgi:hypothetical protein
MSTLYFKLPPEPNPDLSAIFSRAPEQVKAQLTLGLKLLSKLSDEQISDLLEIVKESLVSTVAVSETEISSQLGMSSEEALALLTTSNVIAVTLSTRDDSVEQFISAITKIGLISEKESEGPARFAKAAIQNKDSFNESLERSSLSAESLPVMTEFEATVDLRPSFERETNQIGFVVPVLVMHIDTDKYGQEIWFQLTRRQLEKMIEGLKTALAQIDAAENWAKKVIHPQPR